MKSLLPLLVSVVALAAPRAATAQDRMVTASAELSPAREVFYVGEAAEYVLTLRYIDCEPMDQLFVDGMPNTPVLAERRHDFRMVGQPSADVDPDGRNRITLRIAAPLHFRSPGQVALAPRVGGMAGKTVRRGFFTQTEGNRFPTIAVEPVSFAVKALPEPAPETFCGAMGDFRLDARVTPAEAAPGDLVTLEWTLSSASDNDGLASLRSVALSAPGFRAYPPRGKGAGKREAAFTQVFVPETMSSTNLPPLRVTVFDTAAGAYRTLEAGPFPLAIVERAGDPAKLNFAGNPGDPAKLNFAGNPDEDLANPVPAGETPAKGGLADDPPFESLEVGVVVSFPRDRETRLCPSAASRALADIPAGAEVRVLEKANGWIRVAPATGEGVSAWVPCRVAE